MNKIPFIKMHGIGNDYVYIDCFENNVSSPEQLSVLISNRSFGVGSNGLILICPSSVADAKMRMFNADGSEGTMCGNGIRCVGKYVAEKLNKNNLEIETLSGVKPLSVEIIDDIKAMVTVDMGFATLETKSVPIISKKEKLINEPMCFGNKTYNVTTLSVGNPHAVIFNDDISGLPLEEIGPLFEKSPVFPNSVNTEFAKMLKRNEFNMRVWERGSAETLACGTGACAVALAACLNGLADFNAEIVVHLLGGDLYIVCSEELHVTMKGEAQTVFEGYYYM